MSELLLDSGLVTNQELQLRPTEVLDRFQGKSFLDSRVVMPFIKKADMLVSGKSQASVINPFQHELIFTGPSAVGKSLLAEQSAVYLQENEELASALAGVGRKLNIAYMSTGSSVVEAALQRPDLVDLSKWGKFRAPAWVATTAIMRYSMADWMARTAASRKTADIAIIDTIAILNQYDIGNSLAAMLGSIKNSSLVQVKFDWAVQRRALKVRDAFWEDNGAHAAEIAAKYKTEFDVDLNKELDRVRLSCGNREGALKLVNPRFRKSIIDAMPHFSERVYGHMLADGVLNRPRVWSKYQEYYYEYLANLYGFDKDQILRDTNELITDTNVHAYLGTVDKRLVPFTKVSDQDWDMIGLPVPKNIQELRVEANRKVAA